MSEKNRRLILLADDEPHVIYVLKLNLEQAGHDVMTTTNGQTAYELACTHAPDLVVTDYQMPGGSGIELAQRLHGNEDTRHIPLILLTARAHHLGDKDIAPTAIRQVIDKPFSPRQLMVCIENLLDATEQQHSDAA